MYWLRREIRRNSVKKTWLTLLSRWNVLDQFEQTSNKALVSSARRGSKAVKSLTASPPPVAPSISSMTTHVGLPSAPRPVPASIAFRILEVTVAALRSSDALISRVR